VKFLADLNVAPRTVLALRQQGFDIVRLDEVKLAHATDEAIVAYARAHGHVVVTQDLDFSAIVALSGLSAPSVLSLRLGSAQADVVTERLRAILPGIQSDLATGAIVTVNDRMIRTRSLPIAD
jgi:predicted nuclease of predicted toxin-antitoxin system